MKILKKMTIVFFLAIILLPILKFNFEENSVSKIDNRMLTKNPFSKDSLKGDMTQNIENYISDRIGYRDLMITEYTILNDKVFNKMVHPIYSNGKNGYVFGEGVTTTQEFDDYHIVFAGMIKKIQTYCAERKIPFLFVFNPAKPAVYPDYIAEGINYNRDWVDLFFQELDNLGVCYLDNTITLKNLANEGVQVFNKKYDANHWNSLGAFYGTQKMLERMQEDNPSVHVNSLSEFRISEEHKDTLLVSKYPIDEMVPVLSMDMEYVNKKDVYDSINIDSNYSNFAYLVNDKRANDNSPKTLVFQGSYMNEYGYPYLANALEEYIFVHNYQNVIDFPYYYNLFRPDYVIFEVTEYTLSNSFFDYGKMKEIDFNPTIENAKQGAKDFLEINIPKDQLQIETQKEITTIRWNCEQKENKRYVWLILEDEYDMVATEDGFQVSIDTKEYEKYQGEIMFVTKENNEIYHYKLK